MENILLNKFKFFAQYYGQDVLTVGNALADNVESNWIEESLQHTQYIILKPLTELTNEQLIYISEIWHNKKFERYNKYSNILEEIIINEFILPLNVSDFLRLNSFALAWNGLNIYEQIKRGYFKFR